MNKIKLILSAIILSSAVSVFAAPDPAKVMPTQLETVATAGGLIAIQGVITNSSDVSYKHVFVKFDLFDANGVLVGNTADHASNLQPGRSWRFKAVAPQQFDSYSVSSVDIY
jgi:hypothetical protein